MLCYVMLCYVLLRCVMLFEPVLKPSLLVNPPTMASILVQLQICIIHRRQTQSQGTVETLQNLSCKMILNDCPTEGII